MSLSSVAQCTCLVSLPFSQASHLACLQISADRPASAEAVWDSSYVSCISTCGASMLLKLSFCTLSLLQIHRTYTGSCCAELALAPFVTQRWSPHVKVSQVSPGLLLKLMAAQVCTYQQVLSTILISPAS